MRYFVILCIIVFLSSCRNKIVAPQSIDNIISQEMPFYEKTMIINEEEDNSLEGNYLFIQNVIDSEHIKVNLLPFSYLNHNFDQWMVGYGNDLHFEDNGSENLFLINGLDSFNQTITLGKRLTGTKPLTQGKRVVFYNRAPSGFINSQRILDASLFKGFRGQSMDFGAILEDPQNKKWYMFVQEVDTIHHAIYLASSFDLKNWQAENSGMPILTNKDFAHTNWSYQNLKDDKIQCARIYSSLLYNDTVFYYFDGFDSAGIRNIGMGFRPLSQPNITILPNAILTLDKKYKNENGAFFARVIRLKNKFILCYDAIGALNRETVSFASSTNLFQWSQSITPNIDDHFGWRNGIYTSETSYFTCHKNYLFVHSGGYKKFNTEYTTEELPANFSISHKDQSQKGKYVSGNVADAEQGLFYADANNPIFQAYRHNPIFINDYSNTEQDDHLGGNFYFFRTKKSDVILYQAKSKTLKRYSIFYTCKKRT